MPGLQWSNHSVRDPGRTLWAAAFGGWVLLAGAALIAPDLAHHDRVIGDVEAGARPVVALGVFVGAWLVMITAMMLPSTVPMARMFAIATARVEHGSQMRAVFFAAYFAVWLGFAAAALLVDIGLHALIEQSSWLAGREDVVLAGALAVAGVVQFTPLMRRCLRICRDPRAFLYRHYQRGRAAAWSLGVRHGLSCLGCCWALMLVMFAVGAGNLWWMVGLTAVMTIEKTAHGGNKLVAPVGVALLLASAYVTFSTLALGR
jgi:predicted metal-binding membrane protein